MLDTNLGHIETADQFRDAIAKHEKVMICCGRMGPMCIPVYGVMEQQLGLVITRGHRTLEAVPANQREAELLQVDMGAPLMLLDSVSYLDDGTPIEELVITKFKVNPAFKADTFKKR